MIVARMQCLCVLIITHTYLIAIINCYCKRDELTVLVVLQCPYSSKEMTLPIVICANKTKLEMIE